MKRVVGLALPEKLIEAVDRIREFESRSSFVGRVLADSLGVSSKSAKEPRR